MSYSLPTILIVDDDREFREATRIFLEKKGYHVLEVENGLRAKDAIYLHHPDLVLLDMMMPRLGGFPVLEHFHDKEDAPCIVMITAIEGSRHKAYAELLGVRGYLRKPFSMDHLLETVERALAASPRDEEGD